MTADPLQQGKTEFDREILKDAMLAPRQNLQARFEAFGTAGQAGKFKASARHHGGPLRRGEIRAVERKALAGFKMTQVRQSPVARAAAFLIHFTITDKENHGKQ